MVPALPLGLQELMQWSKKCHSCSLALKFSLMPRELTSRTAGKANICNARSLWQQICCKKDAEQSIPTEGRHCCWHPAGLHTGTCARGKKQKHTQLDMG